MALAAQEAEEGTLELLAGAGVDEWIHTTVEVAQPEDHLEHGVGGLQGGEQGACRGKGWGGHGQKDKQSVSRQTLSSM